MTENAEAARAQAEARRKRILEKASQRLGVVNGEQLQTTDYSQQIPSKAARIRAARQRRYGKKSNAPTDSLMAEQPASEVATDHMVVDETSKEKEISEDGSERMSSREERVTKETGNEAHVDAVSSEASKKKYMGVAKTRRRMIMKKKMSENEGPSMPESSPRTSTNVPVKSAGLRFLELPVYMHIATIGLLFIAGVDVGFQQHHVEVQIHDSLSLTENGIGIIQRSPFKDSSPTSIKRLQDDSTSSEIPEDEFEEAFREDFVVEVDPLFGVDLDELAKGPGFFNQLARGAISIHRFVLGALYYAPVQLFNMLLVVPSSLLQMPPALCFLALVVRQVVAKTILKAGIPVIEGGEQGGAIDLLAMVKQWVTQFLSSSFPTAVGMYDAFTHLRADMYVVICGVFSGLAWAHLSSHSQIVSSGASFDQTGEL